MLAMVSIESHCHVLWIHNSALGVKDRQYDVNDYNTDQVWRSIPTTGHV